MVGETVVSTVTVDELVAVVPATEIVVKLVEVTMEVVVVVAKLLMTVLVFVDNTYISA